MEYCTDEQDVVLDAFSGVGSTAAACFKNNRRFIGIERELDFHQAAVTRLTKEFNQPRQDSFDLIISND